MWQYNYNGSPYTNELYHYGVKGMKWGKHLKLQEEYDEAKKEYDTALARYKSNASQMRFNENNTGVIDNVEKTHDTALLAVGKYHGNVDEARYRARDLDRAMIKKKYAEIALDNTAYSKVKKTAQSILSKIKGKTTSSSKSKKSTSSNSNAYQFTYDQKSGTTVRVK